MESTTRPVVGAHVTTAAAHQPLARTSPQPTQPAKRTTSKSRCQEASLEAMVDSMSWSTKVHSLSQALASCRSKSTHRANLRLTPPVHTGHGRLIVPLHLLGAEQPALISQS